MGGSRMRSQFSKDSAYSEVAHCSMIQIWSLCIFVPLLEFFSALTRQACYVEAYTVTYSYSLYGKACTRIFSSNEKIHNMHSSECRLRSFLNIATWKCVNLGSWNSQLSGTLVMSNVIYKKARSTF